MGTNPQKSPRKLSSQKFPSAGIAQVRLFAGSSRNKARSPSAAPHWTDSGGTVARVQIPAMPFASCVALGTFHHLSVS